MVLEIQKVLLFMSDRSVQLRLNGVVEPSHGLGVWGNLQKCQ